MSKLILIRHGESIWNLENRFTGWIDIDLTQTGIQQAIEAGQRLKKEELFFDIAYTSVLKRAVRTLWHIQDVMDLMWVPIVHSWRINERHYGALSGLNKAQTVAQYGEEQVFRWRRAYDVSPPALEENDPRIAYTDPRYATLRREQIPLTESLKDTVKRVLPIWQESIAPALASGKTVAIIAHGNSIRALIKYLESISDEAIVHLDIPNGIPLIYKLNTMLEPVEKKYLK